MALVVVKVVDPSASFNPFIALQKPGALISIPEELVSQLVHDGAVIRNPASVAGGEDGVLNWIDIPDKPTTFAPSAHAASHEDGADGITKIFSADGTKWLQAHNHGLHLGTEAGGAGYIEIQANGSGGENLVNIGGAASTTTIGQKVKVDSTGLFIFTGTQWNNVVAPPASATTAGIIRVAYSAEVITGTAYDLAVSPYGLSQLTSTSTRRGLVELATDAETITGTDTVRAVTPAGNKAALSRNVLSPIAFFGAYDVGFGVTASNASSVPVASSNAFSVEEGWTRLFIAGSVSTLSISNLNSTYEMTVDDHGVPLPELLVLDIYYGDISGSLYLSSPPKLQSLSIYGGIYAPLNDFVISATLPALNNVLISGMELDKDLVYIALNNSATGTGGTIDTAQCNGSVTSASAAARAALQARGWLITT